MTDITLTPAWQKAVEAVARKSFEYWPGTVLSWEEADENVRQFHLDVAAEALKAAPAALAESVEPLTFDHPIVSAAVAAVARAHPLYPVLDALVFVSVNTAKPLIEAPLLARIQALEEKSRLDEARLQIADDLRAVTERQRDAAIEALEEAQWGNDGRCSSCGGDLDAGHHSDCPIGQVLASQPAPETTND